MKRIELTGKKIGKLTVIGLHSRSRNGHLRWECKCDCGNIHNVLSTHLVREKITHCGCVTYRGRFNKLWKGVGDISGNYWDNVRRSANGLKGRRIIELNITKRYAWMIFLRQNRKCALSGVDIHFPKTTTQGNSTTASLDRIDSSKGYVEGNIQWLHKDVNKMKNSFDEEYFVNMCKLIGASCEIVGSDSSLPN